MESPRKRREGWDPRGEVEKERWERMTTREDQLVVVGETNDTKRGCRR